MSAISDAVLQITSPNKRQRQEALENVIDQIPHIDADFKDSDKIFSGILTGNINLAISLNKFVFSDIVSHFLKAFGQSSDKTNVLFSFIKVLYTNWNTFNQILIKKLEILVTETIKTCIKEENVDDWHKINKTMIKSFFIHRLGLFEIFCNGFYDAIGDFEFEEKIELGTPFFDFFKNSNSDRLIEFIYEKLLVKIANTEGEKLLKWIQRLFNSKQKIKNKAREKLQELIDFIQNSKPQPKNSNLTLSKIKDIPTPKKKKNSQAKQSEKKTGTKKTLEKKIKLEESSTESSFALDTFSNYASPAKILKASTPAPKENKSQKPSKRSKSSNEKENSRNVKFDLKSNSTLVFDKRAIIAKSFKVSLPSPGKSILKQLDPALVKKQKKFKKS